LKRLVSVIIGLILIIIMLSSETTVPLNNMVRASVPSINKTDLKSVTAELTAQTGLTDRIDSDGDGLFDKVETVIGTDPHNNDTDFDKLTDNFEVQNGLNPQSADSNNDGLPDYYEVTDVPSLDINNNGVPNAYDPDNDGDGVNDAVDLSPSARSLIGNDFRFNLSTNGKTTYVTFQVKPNQTEYLKLLNKYWDWVADEKGTMKDLDNSVEDLHLVPMLNITANVTPNQADLLEYGITTSGNSAYVPLYAVEEFGTTVAFTGRMIYPQSTPQNLTMKIEMVWKVIGQTDEKATAIKSEAGKYLSVNTEGQVTVTQTAIGETSKLFLVDLGQNTIALKAENGKYLTVADNGTVIANATEIGTREQFKWVTNIVAVLIKGQSVLKAYNGKYLDVKADGSLTATSTLFNSKGFSSVAAGTFTQQVTLMTYKEPFMFTGLTAEENYGSKVGLFFSHNRNESIAANLYLSYAFLRNSTSNLLETPTLLNNQDIEIFSQIGSYSHKDQAFMSLTNELMPNVLSALQAGAGSQILPVINAFEDDFTSLDLSQMTTITAGTSWTANLAAEPVVTTKTLRMALYNTTTLMALEPEAVVSEVRTWEYEPEAQGKLVSLMVAWNVGEQLVTKVGPDLTKFQVDPQLTSVTKAIKLYGISALKAATLVYMYGARLANSIMTITMETGISAWKAAWQSVQSVGLCQTAKLMAFKRVSLTLTAIGAILDTGVALYSLFTILDANLNPMQLYAALMHTVMTLAYSLTLGLIGAIPVVGWLISAAIAISDAIGGWSTKLFDAIINAMCSVSAQVTPSIQMTRDPQIDIIDKDDDGIDVGDRIVISARIKTTLTSGDRECLMDSDMHPYYEIVGPTGTNSTVGYPFLTDWLFMAKDLGYTDRKPWNDVHLMLPIAPYANRTYTSGSGWTSTEYDIGGWIEPGTAMVNFPVTLNMKSEYEMWYKYKIFYFFVFYWFTEEYRGWNAGIQTLGTDTVYFDVLPPTLAGFVNWKSITPLDRDFDGLKNTQETVSNPSLWDTDCDGLNDKYEIDIGTNPKLADTDKDGLNDRLELVYGTNPTKPDTDGDGLTDYQEISGWISVFYYGGELFTLRVTSNPLLKDTDGEGVTDNLECSSRLNPTSQDTNGDGILDQAGEPLPLPDWLLDSDGDGLNDAVEKAGWSITVTNSSGTYIFNVHSDPFLNDTDSDGLSDLQEYNLKTNPLVSDTDGDGVTDSTEQQIGTNPVIFDSDGDGLSDGVEIAFGSNPLKVDTDGEGLSDLEEFQLGSDPTKNDTDADGLNDYLEVQLGANVTLPDTDDDSLLDGQEYVLGTNVTNPDSDGEGLPDGFEVMIGTNPLSNDTDNDQVTDYKELQVGTSPFLNDTDFDGLLDGLELQLGSCPWNNDTDYDMLGDLIDPDTYTANVKQVVVAFDGDSDTLQFIDNIAGYTNVTAVSPEDFIANYTSSPYIILIGNPSNEEGTVGNLITNLLQNYGEHLTNQTLDNKIAVRYGVWNSNQTVVVISANYYADHFRVLSILKSKNVTITDNSITVNYPLITIPNLNYTYSPYFATDEMDMVRATDTAVNVGLDQPVTPSIQITKYNQTTTPNTLTPENGLSKYDTATGKYINIQVSPDVQNSTGDGISKALIRVFYTAADLDRTGDGDANDPADFDENTLSLYYFNETTNTWTKLSTSLDWVQSVGVNTTDLTIYGKHYAGYVWAYVSHLANVSLAGHALYNQSPDVSGAYPSQQYLWNQNHQLENITIQGVTDPDGDKITIRILNVTSDEPTLDNYYSQTYAPDAFGIGTDTAQLRAERLPYGNGRVYNVTFVASDGRGGETIGSVQVYVPLECGHYTDDGQYYIATEINRELT
jgi:hypothetical protein